MSFPLARGCVQLVRGLGTSALLLAGFAQSASAQTYTPYHFATLAGFPGSSGSADGTGSAALFKSPSAVAVDGGGNVFVADSANNTLRKISAGGVVTTLPAPAVAFNAPAGIATDSNGSYVADTGNQVIRKIANGGVVTTLAGTVGVSGHADATGAAASFNSPQGVASDGGSNIYVADTGNNTIRAINAGGVVTTLAGTAGSSGQADGTGAVARFSSPYGIAADGNGNVYVADSGNNTIRKIVIATGVVTTIAGTAGTTGSSDGTGTAARFNNPCGLAAGPNGNLYVADTGNHTIRLIQSGGVVTTLGGVPGTSGSADGTGSTALFKSPYGVAVDGSGNVYVADTANDIIRTGNPNNAPVTHNGATTTPINTPITVLLPATDADGDPLSYAITNVTNGTATPNGKRPTFTPTTGFTGVGTISFTVNDGYANSNSIGTVRINVGSPAYHFTTYAGSPGTNGYKDGTGSGASFTMPRGVAVDNSGNVFVADTHSYNVRKIASGGVVTTLAGPMTSGTGDVTGFADGTGGAARFSYLGGVAADKLGNVFVADTTNNAIRRVTSAGVVTTLVGINPGFSGSAPTGSVDGAASVAEFNLPGGIAVDGSGTIYVADTENDTIREISPTGQVTTLAGTGGSFGGLGLQGSTDATGTAARFYFPNGLALDNSGNIYVADTFNHTIRKITSAGVVTTLAGTAGVSGHADGTGAAASFNYPTGIGVDGGGNIFVCEEGNQTVRKITPTGVVTTIAGGSAGSSDGTGSAAQFIGPYGLAVDATGTIYIADTTNGTIRMGVPDHAPVATNSSTSTTVGLAVVVSLPATDADGDTLTYAVTGATSGTTSAVTGNHTTFTPTITTSGTGTVTFTASDGFYTSNVGTITISIGSGGPAAAIVVLQNLSQTYSGSPETVTVATSPKNVANSVTYNGSATPPTAAGSYAVVATVTDPSYTGSASGTFNILQAPATIALDKLTQAADGTPKSVTVTTTPQGLATTVTYSGSSSPPSAVGVYSVLATITDPNYLGSTSVSLNLYGPSPVITSAPTSVSVVAGGSAHFAVVATGAGQLTYEWQKNGADIAGATGVGMNVLSLSNLTLGSGGSITVIVKNGTSSVTSPVATLTVLAPAPVLGGASSVTGIEYSPFNYQVQNSSTSSTTFSLVAGTLHTGLSLNPTTGTISGTPTITGTSTVTISATNASGTATLQVTITISPPIPAITGPAAANGQVGVAFSYSPGATNGANNFSASNLPPGLNIDLTGGAITGTPTQAGTFVVTLTAGNATGSVTQPLTITITAAANTPVYTGGLTLSGTQGTAFNFVPTFTNNPTVFVIAFPRTHASSLTPSATDVGTQPAGLPTGLSFNTSTGAITGTPTQLGVFGLYLEATGTGGTAITFITLTINPSATAPSITSASTAAASVGIPFTFTITVSPAATSFTSSTLPTGLTLNTTTGAITGTPTQAGFYNVQLTAANTAGSGPTAFLVITVNPSDTAAVVTSAPVVQGTTGSPLSYTLLASGTPTGFAITSGTLPAGLTLNGATVSGTPTQAGQSTVWFAASNAAGQGFSLGVLFNIAPGSTTPVITSNGTARGQVGQAFTYLITATNSPTSFAATGLPDGLSVDTVAGLISGIPTTATTEPASIILTATNASGASNPRTVLLQIAPASATPAIVSSTNASGRVGTAFTYLTAATAGPTSFAAQNLPPGLAIDPTSGAITGTPTVAGTYLVTLQAGNAVGLGAAASLNLTIAASLQAPAITSPATAVGKVQHSFSYTITASPGPITGYALATGTLPLGLSLNTSTGVISGNPAEPGAAVVTVTASNSAGTSLPLALLISINPVDNVPVITSSIAALGTVGQTFTFTVTATNMPAAPFPPSTTLDAVNLPPGLAVNPATGVISGVPTQAGAFTASLIGTNAVGTGATSNLTIFIIPATGAPVVTSVPFAAAQVGTFFAYAITATNTPFAFQVLDAPDWMTVGSQTGIISGTPTLPGRISLQLIASNSAGDSNPLTLSLSVEAAATTPIVTSSLTAAGTVGSSFSYQITVAAGAPAPTDYLATGLPSGLALDSRSGVIAGNPTISGTFAVVISATNDNGYGRPVTVAITIQPNLQVNF